MTKPILVAGVGNIFLGDDAFGVEVANRLMGRHFPPHVKVADFGIRGLHLAYDMMDNGYGLVILVDTVSQGDEPGTITVMEIDPTSDGEQPPDAHDMDPANVLALLADLGGQIDRLLLVGCEPAVLDEGIGLSDRLEAVVDEAVRVVEELIVEETSAYAGKES